MKSKTPVVTNAIYWGATVLFAAMMTASAIGYLTAPFFAAAFTHLGFPGYFRVELGVAKLLGVIVLLAPVPRRLKEWAYAGFAITLVSAFIAHSSVDGVQTAIGPVVALGLLIVSYVFLDKREKATETVRAGNALTAG